jgi:hypothetical protein
VGRTQDCVLGYFQTSLRDLTLYALTATGVLTVFSFSSEA